MFMLNYFQLWDKKTSQSEKQTTDIFIRIRAYYRFHCAMQNPMNIKFHFFSIPTVELKMIHS